MVLGILTDPPHLEITPLFYLATRKQASMLEENILKLPVKWKTYMYSFFNCLLGSLKIIHLALKLLLGVDLGPSGKVYKSIHLGPHEATGFPGQWVN